MEKVELPRDAVVCAARHYIAAHESLCRDVPVDFAWPCFKCECWSNCKGQWLETAKPIFDAAGVHPQLLRPRGSELS